MLEDVAAFHARPEAAAGPASISGETRGSQSAVGTSTMSFFAYLPSLWRCVVRMPFAGIGLLAEHDGGGAVAEDDGDLAPGGRQVEARRMRLRADDEHAPRLARPDELVGHGEHVEEARALVADVHRRHAAQPEMAEQHRAPDGKS